MANFNKTKSKTYHVSNHAFTNMKKIVPGTGVVAGIENKMYYSMKNTEPSKISGEIQSVPAYEITLAVAQAKKVPEILCVGLDDGKKFYYGGFKDEQGNPINSFMLYPDEKKILTSDFESSNLYIVMMAMNIAEFILKGYTATAEDAEIFELFNKINFGNSIIDTDQAEVLYPLVDSIYFEAKKFNGGDMIYQAQEVIADKVINSDVKYNLIQLISEADPLELDSGIVPEMKAPTKKSRKKLSKSKKGKSADDENVDITELDNKIMSDEEAKDLPPILQVMRQQAIDFYEKNKEFLTDEQKSMIKSFKRGRLWKLGLFGPSATGKTSFVKSLAGSLGLPYMIVVGSKGMDETALFGKYVLKNGETVFEYGPLTLMMKYGGLFLLDEENMVAPEVVSSMNSVLDDTRLVTLDSGEVVQCHPNFRYCEAMNMAYAGTLEQNLSHESRIQMYMKMSGYDVNTEASIVVQSTGIDKATAKKIVKLKNKIADIIENDPEADDTTQRVDLRSCIAWAERTIDCDGDIMKASLSTILSSLVKEDDNVKSSATMEEYEKSQEVAASVVDVIKEACRRSAPVKQQGYVFESYSL